MVGNMADLMANVAIEKPLSYALSIGYLQETSSLLCRIHRFPREKTVVSTRETDGFRRGNRWIPAWRLMETCVNLAFPDFTRHFFSSLAETVDSCFVVVLNR